MKNPANIDEMIEALFASKQQAAIKEMTRNGYSKLEAIRRLMNEGIELRRAKGDSE